MVIVNKTIREILEEVGRCKVLRRDIISPGNNPEIFLTGWVEEGLFGGPSHDYRDTVLGNLELGDDDRKGLQMVFAECVTNGVEWGNNRNPDYGVRVSVLEGKSDYLIEIEDSGKGFDYSERIAQMRTGGGYANRGGSGLASLELEDVEATFCGTGNILVIRKNKKTSWEEK